MQVWIKRFCCDRDGATLLEYALLLALIAMVCVAVIQQLGVPQQATYEKVDTTLQNAGKAKSGESNSGRSGRTPSTLRTRVPR